MTTAAIANSKENWDKLWKYEHDANDLWRPQAMNKVYGRIAELLQHHNVKRAIDLGGGVGFLGERLQAVGVETTVWDHSEEALRQAKEKGLAVKEVDLNGVLDPVELVGSYLIATEVFEHLSEETRDHLLRFADSADGVIISVPNNRLGPDEEPQHTVKFTCIEFLRTLRKYFAYVRVEVLGPFLLGVCKEPAKKGFTLSVTLPVRDEEADLGRTLASFRAIADEMVIGVDPRTADNTWVIAEEFADKVFWLENPEANMGPGKVHFANIRNQCIAKCTSQWIFMTEGHESLSTGTDTLLHLDKIMPEKATFAMVLRQGNGQQWAYPWLFRNEPAIAKFVRDTHNELDIPKGAFYVRLPSVRTLHKRHDERSLERAKQRKIQNRKSLMEDWYVRGSEQSLFYLGGEWREHDPNRAINYLEQYLALPPKNGPMRYQARLILAKTYGRKGELSEDPEVKKEFLKRTREVLLRAGEDDWSRTEHFLWLGDLAYNAENYEEALQWYRYAGTTAGEPPFTAWWIDISTYSYLPAQRLAQTYGELGRLSESLYWAKKVLELLPEDVPIGVIEEAQTNISLLEEALNGGNN